MKRMLLLTDDELLVLVAWAEVARSASDTADLPGGVVLHDFGEEDQVVLAKIEEVRLK